MEEYYQDQELQTSKSYISEFNTLRYKNTKYLYKQYREILLGIKSKVNVDLYAYKNIHWTIMEQIRLGLEDGINLTEFMYIFDWHRLEQIRLAKLHNLDISLLLKCTFDGFQLKQIRLGLMNNIDVSLYSNNMFSWCQMEQIRLGLMNNIDVSLYSDNMFSWSQMEQIRLGLEEGIDVLKYNKQEYNINKMKQIRKSLKNKF